MVYLFYLQAVWVELHSHLHSRLQRRWYSVKWWVNGVLRSFEIIETATNQKPKCNCLLVTVVTNSNLSHISHFWDIATKIWEIPVVDFTHPSCPTAAWPNASFHEQGASTLYQEEQHYVWTNSQAPSEWQPIEPNVLLLCRPIINKLHCTFSSTENCHVPTFQPVTGLCTIDCFHMYCASARRQIHNLVALLS